MFFLSTFIYGLFSDDKNKMYMILGFLVFGYAMSNLLRAIVLKTMYNVEGETKVKMYEELEKMREERRKENELAESK